MTTTQTADLPRLLRVETTIRAEDVAFINSESGFDGECYIAWADHIGHYAGFVRTATVASILFPVK